MPLSIGPIVFSDFELPEVMPFGGEQILVVKKLVGGDRVVDAMGRDDNDKEWSGRFRGPLAETRARELDTLRIAGQQLILGWNSLLFLVVIKSFKAATQGKEVPYSINCLVIQDLSNPILPASIGSDNAINSDMNSATLLTPVIGISSITGPVSDAANLIAQVATFSGASAGQISSVQSGLQTALAAVNGQANAQNGIVASTGTVAGMAAGVAPQTLAAGLTAQSGAFQQLGQLSQLQSLLGRTSLNVQNAGS